MIKKAMEIIYTTAILKAPTDAGLQIKLVFDGYAWIAIAENIDYSCSYLIIGKTPRIALEGLARMFDKRNEV